jgi:hypothetical protein
MKTKKKARKYKGYNNGYFFLKIIDKTKRYIISKIMNKFDK